MMRPANSLLILGKLGTRVYQRVKPGLGNVPGFKKDNIQNRLYVAVNLSNTPKQAAHRLRMRNAVLAWQSATAAEKAPFVAPAAKRAILVYHAFLSAHLENALATGFPWDGGASIWDEGASIWLY